MRRSKLLTSLNVFVLSALTIPLVVGAQLESENFTLEKYAIGAAQDSAIGTSTNFTLSLEPGSLYLFDETAQTDPTDGPSGSRNPPEEPATDAEESTAKLVAPTEARVGERVFTLVVSLTSQFAPDAEVIISVSHLGEQVSTTASLVGSAFVATFVPEVAGEYIVRAVVNGDSVALDSDGNNDGRVTVLVVAPIAEPVLPFEPNDETTEVSLLPDTTATTTADDNSSGTTLLETTFAEFGITQFCNRVFVWDAGLSVGVYRSFNSGSWVHLATTSPRMPWYVDQVDSDRQPVEYLLRTHWLEQNITFTAEDYGSCQFDLAVVTNLDADADSRSEYIIENIFQDIDGSSVPVARTEDGLVLDTIGNGTVDTFWNPGRGVSPVIAADDSLYIVNDSVTDTTQYEPLIETNGYRVTLSQANSGLVELTPITYSLIPVRDSGISQSSVAIAIDAVPIESISLAGLLTLLWLRLLRTPFSVTRIGNLLAHSWHGAFGFLTLRKRRRPWGTVYDVKTKAPVDPAYVELFSESGAHVADAITDLDGRYGFVVEDGTYYMKVDKTNYTFPVSRLGARETDVIYSNIYYGDTFTSDGSVAFDIPMEPLKFDWNQYEKLRTKQTRFFHQLDPFIVRFLDLLSWVGLGFIIWQFITIPNLLNLIWLVVFAVSFVSRFFVGKPILYGVLKKNGYLLPNAIIKVYSGEHVIAKKIADESGRYAVIIPPGSYRMTIEERTGEEQYQVVYDNSVDASGGILNTNITIQ
ncbi:hypothetical protein N9L26_00125 [Candidatus Pacebacteria bacterium]|nr:hypothetical protein [Candidatus Paceibacterota bacterium]